MGVRLLWRARVPQPPTGYARWDRFQPLVRGLTGVLLIGLAGGYTYLVVR